MNRICVGLLFCLTLVACRTRLSAVTVPIEHTPVDERSLAALMEDLDSPDPVEGEAAARALAARAPASIPLLMDELRKRRSAFRVAQAASFVSDAEHSIVPFLIDILTSDIETRHAKRNAATVAGFLGPRASAAVPILVGLVSKGGIDPFNELGMRQGDWSAEAALERIGEAAVKPLSRLLSYPDERIQSRAVRILGGIGRSALEADEEIANALRSDSPNHRWWVLGAILKIGRLTPPIEAALNASLTQESSAVLREMAKEALKLPRD